MNIKEIAQFTEKSEKCVRRWVEMACNSDHRVREKINSSKNISKIDFTVFETLFIIKKGVWKNKRILSYLEANIRREDFMLKTGENKHGCFECYFFHPTKKGHNKGVYCMHPDNVVMEHNALYGMSPAIKDRDIIFTWNAKNDCKRFKIGSIYNYKM